MKPALIVMAAGMGSRYGGLKQLDPIGPAGELVIDYSVFDAIQTGFEKIIFVIRKDIEKAFRDSIGARFESQIDIDYAFQEVDTLPSGFILPKGRTKPWGTGHAILVAAGKIQSNFGVINADDFYGRESFRILANHLASSPDRQPPVYALVGFLLKNTLSDFGTVSRGVCHQSPDGSLSSVQELTHISRSNLGIQNLNPDGSAQILTGHEWVSMNMWGFKPSLLKLLEQEFSKFLKDRIRDPKSEFYISSFISQLLSSRQASVQILETPESWFGVTYPQDKAVVVEKIRALIQKGIYPPALHP